MDEARTLEGRRKFVWFTPKRRNPTEYENYTVGQQSSPDQWLVVDWPLRFDDGRAPFSEDATALRCSNWGSWRDPAQIWQRPYVVATNQEEQALDRLVPSSLGDGLATNINPVWVREVLGKYYAAWPYVDYGIFLALCYAVREAIGDTMQFALAFEAADKMRHVQDVVHLTFNLAEALPGYTDQAAREAWMEDPVLVPTRENVERIFSSNDWGEIVVAANLVFEPLVADLAKTEFFARNAARNGDPASGMILAGVRRDSHRHLESSTDLVRMFLGDPEYGDRNRAVVTDWMDRWTVVSDSAAQALAGMFAIPGIEAEPFEPCLARVRERHRSIREELGV